MNFIEKRIFIERSELEIINTYKPCKDLKTIKNNLFHVVKKTIGDKWFQLTENTQQMLKKFCLLGNKRGLVFIDPKKLAKEFGLSLATLNIYLKKLTQSNVIIKLYRRSTRHNGKGAPVFLFVNHPYFPMWADMLRITIDDSQIPPSGPFMPDESLAYTNTNFKAESEEIPCTSKAEKTFFAPNSLELKDNLNNILLNDSLNINESKKDTSKKSSFTKFIKYVPKVLQHFGVFFGDTTKNMYERICKAAKTAAITNKESIRLIAFRVMDQLKINIKNGRSFTDDELCAYSYKTALIHFTKDDNNVIQVSEGDNNVNQDSAITDKNAAQDSKHDNQDNVITVITNDTNMIQDPEGDNNVNQDTSTNNNSYNEYTFRYSEHDNQVNHAAKKHYKREEMVPNWLNKDANTITPKQATTISEERKKAIWDQVNNLSCGSI